MMFNKIARQQCEYVIGELSCVQPIKVVFNGNMKTQHELQPPDGGYGWVIVIACALNFVSKNEMFRKKNQIKVQKSVDCEFFYKYNKKTNSLELYLLD